MLYRDRSKLYDADLNGKISYMIFVKTIALFFLA